MNEVKKFDHKVFGELRVLIVDDEELFVGNDVASMLGYSDTNQATRNHCKSLIILKGVDSTGLTTSPRGIGMIPEKDVYRLIMRSNLPQAEVFQEWVMEEVLPTIRKGGGYVDDVDLLMDRFYSHLDDHTKLVIKSGLVFQRDNQHKISFADDVSEVTNLLSVNQVAKSFGTGRNKFYALLREEDILMSGNLPYQRYIDQGYFEVKQVTKNGKVYSTTLVTGKGELWLHRKLDK